MSYILDALKKADQERDIGHVPNLATPQETKRPQTRSYRWLWIVALLLAVNAVLVAMVLKNRSATDAGMPATANVAPEIRTNPVDEQPVQPAPKTIERPATDKVTVETPVREAPVAEAPVPAAKEPVRSAGEVVVLGDSAYFRDSAAQTPPRAGAFAQMDSMNSREESSQLQRWYDLPQDIRNRTDLPDLDVHVYAEDPLRRFIMVNLKKYREGQSLPNGMTLEEVLPDGMVMSYRGERFRVDK